MLTKGTSCNYQWCSHSEGNAILPNSFLEKTIPLLKAGASGPINQCAYVFCSSWMPVLGPHTSKVTMPMTPVIRPWSHHWTQCPQYFPQVYAHLSVCSVAHGPVCTQEVCTGPSWASPSWPHATSEKSSPTSPAWPSEEGPSTAHLWPTLNSM